MKNYTLVLGAGSSVDFGLPTGKELVDFITNHFDQDYVIRNAKPPADFKEEWRVKETQEYLLSESFNKILNLLGFESKDVRQFTDRLRGSNLNSIDTFLARARNKELLPLGKAIICLSILHYERNSNLNADTWLKYLWNRFIEAFLNPKTPPRFQIVTFNYDRCFEQFMFESIKQTTDFPDVEIVERIEVLNIFHVHGCVGSLPWEGGSDPIEFGSEANSNQIKAAMNGLSIVHEKTEDVNKARDMIVSSNQTYFLGFGYHPDNLEKLFDVSSARSGAVRPLIGTFLGIGHARQKDTNRKISQLTNGFMSIKFMDGKISQVLDDHMKAS